MFSLSYNCLGQDQSPDSNHTPVIVTEWNKKSFLFAEEFWNGKKEEIERQMGEGGLERLKKYSHYKNIPESMVIFSGGRKKNSDEFYSKLGQLKNLQMIAVFRHVFQGNDFGNYVVIQVPYKGNENWEPGVKWDTVYFIFKEEYIEIR
jgi:hypothetical protein